LEQWRKIDGSTVLFLRKVREWKLEINNIPAPKQCKNFCKFYFTSKQSEHVFHYLSRLITGQTLENNSSSSNSHAKFGQKGQTRAQVALFVSNPNQAANKQESDCIASWEIRVSL